MIQFICPHCTFKITAGDSVAGQAAQCPLCEKDIVVPNVQAPSAAAPDTEYRERGVNAPRSPVADVADVPLSEPVDALPADDDYSGPDRRDTDVRYTDRPGAGPRMLDDDFGGRPRHLDDEVDNEFNVRRRGPYADCPMCHAPGYATKVGFTWWGGFIGPAIISCVRCKECGTQYNGTHGDSNGTRILIYTLVVVGIAFGLCLFGNLGVNVFSARLLNGLGGAGPIPSIPASSSLKGGKR